MSPQGLNVIHTIFLAIIAALAILCGGFILLLFIVALCEKRLTHCYEAESCGSSEKFPEYVTSREPEIEAAGFVRGENIRHRKPSVNIRGAMWFSPNHDTLVLCGAGTISRLPSRKTMLLSLRSDGYLVRTADQADTGDITGIYQSRYVLGATFSELLDVHEQQTADKNALIPFPESSPLEALNAIHGLNADLLAQRGYLRWGDERHTFWRYSTRGPHKWSKTCFAR